MKAIITLATNLLSYFTLMSFTLISFNCTAAQKVNLYQQLYKTQQTSLTKDSETKKIQEMLSKLKEVEKLPALDVPPFHFQGVQTSSTEQGLAEQSFCADCHTSTPHKKSVRTRSFLNMHSKSIACETCHLNVDQKLSYQWLNSQEKLVDKINFEDKNSYLLVPVHQDVAVNTSKNSNFSKDILQQWQKNKKYIMQKDQQAKQESHLSKQALLWQNIHQALNSSNVIDNKEPAQQTCISCHQQNDPKLNLFALGASKQRQQSFEQNIIARFFSRYKKEDDKINLIELLK